MRLSDGAVDTRQPPPRRAEREQAHRPLLRPYHQAIDRVIDQCLAAGVAPVLLSIHSFTESWKATPAALARRRAVGQDDGAWPNRCCERFYAEGDLIVGDNEPYSGSSRATACGSTAPSAALPTR